jgi:hypothetical protein
VHGAAFPFAVTRFFTQQLGKHPVNLGALGEAVTMTAVGAGDVIVGLQSFADAYRNRLFPAVEMSQTGHTSCFIQVVDSFFEIANFQHLFVDVQPLLDIDQIVACLFG